MAAATASEQRALAMAALSHSFKAAFAAVRRLRGRDTHRTGELSHAQFQLLFELFRAGELPAGELAILADLSPASVTQMLDRLAETGLVDRVRSVQDRRLVVSRLTDSGREVCEQRQARFEPLWTQTLEEFSAAELQTAADVLAALRQLFVKIADWED